MRLLESDEQLKTFRNSNWRRSMTDEWRDLVQPGLAEDFFSLGPIPSFEPVLDRFSAGLALWMAEFSRLIYRQESDEIDTPSAAKTRSHFLPAFPHRWREVKFFNPLGKNEEKQGHLWRLALPAEDTQAALIRSDE